MYGCVFGQVALGQKLLWGLRTMVSLNHEGKEEIWGQGTFFFL